MDAPINRVIREPYGLRLSATRHTLLFYIAAHSKVPTVQSIHSDKDGPTDALLVVQCESLWLIVKGSIVVSGRHLTERWIHAHSASVPIAWRAPTARTTAIDHGVIWEGRIDIEVRWRADTGSRRNGAEEG